MSIDFWTGGPMAPVDALAKLVDDGFPTARFEARPPGTPRPLYTRTHGQNHESANASFEHALASWHSTRDALALADAGTALLGLLTADALHRARSAEWRADHGSERAVFALATAFARECPGTRLAYVVGAPEHLNDIARQGTASYPGSNRPKLDLPVTPRAYFAFMSMVLVLCPVPGARFPAIVASDAYAVGAARDSADDNDDWVRVGIMPRVPVVGVVGASSADVAAAIAALPSPGPVLDAADFKTRLRLRRTIAAAKSDNPS